MQQVLSVTFLLYRLLSLLHLLCDSKFFAGELNPSQIIIQSFTIMDQHLDLSHVANSAISQAFIIYFSA
jgi:hypothetical protein